MSADVLALRTLNDECSCLVYRVSVQPGFQHSFPLRLNHFLVVFFPFFFLAPTIHLDSNLLFTCCRQETRTSVQTSITRRHGTSFFVPASSPYNCSLPYGPGYLPLSVLSFRVISAERLKRLFEDTSYTLLSKPLCEEILAGTQTGQDRKG